LTRFVSAHLITLLTVVAAGPLLAECVAWSGPAGDRHACCARGGDEAPQAGRPDCCAMSDASGGARSTESPAAPGPAQLVRARADLATDLFLPPRVPSVTAASPLHAASVPRYLQQRSLLI